MMSGSKNILKLVIGNETHLLHNNDWNWTTDKSTNGKKSTYLILRLLEWPVISLDYEIYIRWSCIWKIFY